MFPTATTPESLVDLNDAVGTDGVAQLIELFIDEAPKSRAAFVAALDDGNADDLRRAAHSLKSASGYLGMRELSDMAQQIEQMVVDGHAQDALEQARKLPPLLDSTVDTLNGHLRQIVAH